MPLADQYDVIVIGAGIAGIGCAAMLDPALSVLVLEREAHCGYHSSGRSAAIFVPSYGGPEIRSLTQLSERYLQDAPDDVDCQSYLLDRGEMVLATDKDEEILEELLTFAPTLQEISVAEAAHWVPILNTAPLQRVAVDTTARDIDVDLLLQSWQKKLLRRTNASLQRNQQVTALQPPPHSSSGQHEKRWKVTTTKGKFYSKIVVNAAGAWADSIAKLAALPSKGLVPCRRSAALIPPPGNHAIQDWPLIAAAAETWYAKPMGGKLMISPAEEEPVEPQDAFADDLTLAEGIDRYEQAVTVPVTHVEHSWAGLRTFAPDRVPVVGFDTDLEGFFWLAGQGGYGIQTSPALSTLAAGLISDDSLDDELLALSQALSPSRLSSA